MSETGVLSIKGSDEVAKTAVAKQTIPLGLASHMSQEELMSVERVMLTKRLYNSSAGSTFDVKEAYTVQGYEWFSPVMMFFKLQEGGQVQISDGDAWYSPANGGLPIAICSTNVECAQFKVSGIDVDELFTRSNHTSPQGHRRALAQSTEGCSDMSEFGSLLQTVVNQSITEFISDLGDAENMLFANLENMTVEDALALFLAEVHARRTQTQTKRDPPNRPRSCAPRDRSIQTPI